MRWISMLSPVGRVPMDSNVRYYSGAWRQHQHARHLALDVDHHFDNIGYQTLTSMELRTFFPYRLARLAEVVSQATAQVYAERFGLTRDEWRIVAALAGQNTMKTTRIAETSTLDKMRVSRALARLEKDGLVAREPDPEDGRAWLVTL